MTDRINAMLELEKRGKLPPEYAAALKEARSRGLIEGSNLTGESSIDSGQPLSAEKPAFWSKENWLPDDNDDSHNTGEKVAAAINKAGESLTFGLVGDEADAWVKNKLGGGTYEEELAKNRKQEEVLERDNPGLALGADIAGGVTGAVLPFGAVGALAKGAGLMPRVAASAGTGAAMGGTYGLMEGEGLEGRLNGATTGATWGGAAGSIAPIVGAGVQKYATARAGRKAIKNAAKGAPTTEDLLAEARAAYQQIDDAGVQIKPDAFRTARDDIEKALLDGTGYDALPGPGGNTPKAARVMQTMDESVNAMAKEPTAALPFKAVDQVRRRASSPMLSPDRVEQSAGQTIVGGLDDFVKGLGEKDVVAGDIDTLKKVLPKARDLWARMSRSRLIDDAAGLGEEAYLSGSGTGIKYQFKRILKNPKLSKGFSEAERAAMARVVNGTIPEKVLRAAGSGLTQIGGTIAALAGGGPIAGLATLGGSMGARALSDKMIQKNAEVVRALVANGGLKNLPVAQDGVRKVTESLLRRGGAVIPQ